MLTKLNKIDKNLVSWMSKISYFFLPPGKIQPVRNQRVTHVIHKTILVCDRIAQIHTNMQRNVIVTSCTAVKWYVTV